MPPPVAESGRLERTLIAFAALGKVNWTYCPGARLTADLPDASAASVYACVFGPMIVPLVAAFSASCSTNGTSAPRPAGRGGGIAGPLAMGRAAAGSVAAPARECTVA